MDRIGIVAGNGQLPLIAIRSALKKGHQVFVCAIREEAEEAIEALATETYWVKLGELKKLVNFFKKKDVSNVLFAGKITKASIFSGKIKPDVDMIVVFATMKDRKDDTILAAICDYLEKKGLHVLDSILYLDECLPGKGVLTKKKPAKSQIKDIQFGWTLAKECARLDIGQAVVVKEKAVLAVEAIEGTDEAIKRGGALGRGGVVVKVAKPNQDMRFDVPTVGPDTIASMLRAGVSVLAFEAEKTIFVDQEAVITMANKNSIAIIGWQ